MGSNDKIKNLHKWCHIQTDEYGIEVKNFTTSWRNGIAFCAILQNYTSTININTLNPDDVFKNCELAFKVGEEEFGIPQLLEPSDMVALKCPDRLSIITYLFTVYSKLYKLEKRPNSVFNSIENMTKKAENIKIVVPDELNKISNDKKEEQENIPASQTEVLPMKCIICSEPVFMLEKFTIVDKMYHRKCYRQNQLNNLKIRNLTLERPKNNSTIIEKVENNEETVKIIKSQSDHNVTESNLENTNNNVKCDTKVGEDNNSSIDLYNKNMPSLSLLPPIPNKNHSASLENITDEISEDKSNLNTNINLLASNDSLSKSRGSNLSINSDESREIKKRHAPLPPPPLAQKPEKPVVVPRPRSCKPSINKPPNNIERKNVQNEEKKKVNDIEYPDNLNPFGFDEKTKPSSNRTDKSAHDELAIKSVNNTFDSSSKNNHSSAMVSINSTFNDSDVKITDLSNSEDDLLNPFQEFMNDNKKDESRSITSTPKPIIRKKPAPKLPITSESVVSGLSQTSLVTKNPFDNKERNTDPPTLPSQLDRNFGSGRQSRMSSMSAKHPAPSRPIPPKRKVRGDISCEWVPFEKIYSDLEEVNQKQTEIEARGRMLQNKLWEAQNQDDAFEDMLQDWLDLVNEKNDLFTAEKMLHEKLKQQELEERHSDLEHELRLLLSKQESLKTASEKAREEELINQILETVNKRSELVEADVEYPITNQELKKPKKSKSTLKKIFSMKRSNTSSKTLNMKATSQFYNLGTSNNRQNKKLFKSNTITE